MASMLSKSLDELIKEKKAGQKGRGTGRGGGKVVGTKSAGRGAQTPAPKARQAGRGAGKVANKPQGSRSQPYAAQNFGRGRGGGRPVIQNQVVQNKGQSKNRVFITGIPYDWDEQNILVVVETAGPVEKLTIFWDPSGRPTGNALCTYRNEQAARQAVAELNGATLGNNTISVTSARADKGGEKGAAKGAAGRGSGGKGAKAAGKTSGKTSGKAAAPKKSFNAATAKPKGGKSGKGAKGSKGSKPTATRVERKEVSKEDLDKQLDKFLSADN